MSVAKKDNDCPGFTTNYFNRCVVCKRELDETFVDSHVKCECGAFIAHVRLQPRQDEFCRKVLETGPDAPTKLIAYGPRAGGKSRTLRDVTLVTISECAQTWPGIPACLMRRNWTQCQESLVEKLKLERPYMWDWYNGIEKQYSFPAPMGGPRLAFKYADTEDDIIRLERGPEFFFMGIDQAEQLRAQQLQRLTGPNRWPGTPRGAAKTAWFLNPGGVGSKYFQDKIIDGKFGNEDPKDFWCIFMPGWTNFVWFQNQGIEIHGHPLTWEIFYSLPDEVPVPGDGKYTNAWLQTLPDDHTFKLFVTQTSEGKKHWSKDDSIRMGDLFGSFSNFEGQAFAGVYNRDRLVIQ